MIYCDMDGVLVHQTRGEQFDTLPWMVGGKDLWNVLAGRQVIILTQVKHNQRFGLTAQEKLAWIDRELGPAVPVIFTPSSRGKGHFARHGDVLIDDDARHGAAWKEAGGQFIQHTVAPVTIAALMALKR